MHLHKLNNNLKLFQLPYETDSLHPLISKETIETHYFGHHAGYLKKLNTLIENTHFENETLENIVLGSDGEIFNNSAQVWNHEFYWKSMKPNSNSIPSDILEVLSKEFVDFTSELINTGLNQFGSGWLWLVKEDNKLAIISTSNADTPIRTSKKPIFVIDLWEHAYYLDYKNNRENYIKTVLNNLINWNFVRENIFNVA